MNQLAVNHLPSIDERMRWVLTKAWEICVQRIASGRILINKESSLQLHYAYTLMQLGELACIGQQDSFKIELETKHDRKNIDVWCCLGNSEAAIELKCFRKASDRAKDTDMYDVLKDISRLESYSHVSHRRFICLTDNVFYTKSSHNGHANSVCIGNGKSYCKGEQIKPSWIGKWKDESRDIPIILNNDITFKWAQIEEWYYLYIEI